MTDLRGRVDDLLERAHRVSAVTLLVRAGILGSGVLGLTMAWPFRIVAGPGFAVFVAFAGLAALAPRSVFPTVAIVLGAGGWVLAVQAYGEPVAYPRLVVVAASLYLVHTLSALAAVLPYDAVLAPGVVIRWLGRAGLVLLLTAVLAVFMLAFPAFSGGRTFLIASLAGLALMAATVGYLARLVGRR